MKSEKVKRWSSIFQNSLERKLKHLLLWKVNILDIVKAGLVQQNCRKEFAPKGACPFLQEFTPLRRDSKLKMAELLALQTIPFSFVSWPRDYKTFSCSTQLSMKFFLLINVKMPTIVGILTFMSGKNSILGLSEPKNSWISWYLYTYEHLISHAQLSWASKTCSTELSIKKVL